jgi:hypothetical protein
MSKSKCQRATQKAKIHAYRVTAVHELKEPDREKRVMCRLLQAFLNVHPGILDFVWFTDEAWFHRQTSSYGAFSKAVCMELGREHCAACRTTSRVRFKRPHRRLSIVCKHVWKPKVETFSICCDGHVLNMKQGTCVINFMLLNVLFGKLYRHFWVRKLVGHSLFRFRYGMCRTGST